MFQNNHKIFLKGYNQSFINEKQNYQNYQYKNGKINQSNNKKINNKNLFQIIKKQNNISLNNSYLNNLYLNKKNKRIKKDIITNKNITNYIISDKSINNNKNNNFRKITNLKYSKDKKSDNSYNNKNNILNNKTRIKTDNHNKSFILKKKDKLLTSTNKENNIRLIYSNNNRYNNHNIIKKKDLNISLLEHKSLKRCNNIFQPINIFSKYKRNKSSNNDDLLKNKKLLKQILEEDEQNQMNINSKIIVKNKNKKANEILENNPSSNINNKTNDTTSISSGNLLNIKNNTNNNAFNKNNYVHEINFLLNGNININHMEKNKKLFKCKKIKCIHDLSKTGLSGEEKKVNQDNYFIFKNFVQGFDNIFMGVCDGHGYYGHEVSGYIKENLPMDLNHMIKAKKLNILKDDLSSIIKTAFILENKSLLRNKQIDSDLSGSTCISVIYTPEKLIIANVGDSRCILGKCIESKEKTGQIFKKKWVSQNLSRDHKPTIPEEAERILKIGGRIRQMKDEDGEFIGPLRVYMKEKDMPGLAMTRSFGDYFGSTAGVISEPEVTEYYFKEEDKFIILASDGLFEFMENQEIIDIVKDYYEKNDIVGCCEYLYKESTRKWLREEEDTIDDITIILVFFENIYNVINI